MTTAYQEIKAAIAAKCQEIGRSEPTLIAVSKTQPDENVRAVLRAGHRVFGENRVQEAAGKWPEFQREFGASELHLLGPLQSNKARQAFGLFDVIHSLDRVKLAKRFADLAQATGHCPEIFVQVNTGAEPQKAGVIASELSGFLNEIKAFNLPIIGLMCIPPAQDDSGPHFRELRRLAEAHGLEGLSMGMSDDFLIAIEEGATHIRVGSAIFGARNYA